MPILTKLLKTILNGRKVRFSVIRKKLVCKDKDNVPNKKCSVSAHITELKWNIKNKKVKVRKKKY